MSGEGAEGLGELVESRVRWFGPQDGSGDAGTWDDSSLIGRNKWEMGRDGRS